MRNTYLPAADEALDDWAINFAAKATTYATTIKLTTDEIKAISDAQKAFKVTIDAHTAAVATAKAQRQAKLTARKALTALASAYNARIQVTPNISNQIKTDLGLTVRKKPTPVIPLTPGNPSVVGTEIGVNTVRWTANGNKPGTAYLVEACVEDSGVWNVVGSVTATRFDHTGQIPGIKVAYRISARRRKVYSVPSASVSVYDSNSATPPVITMDKAA